MGKIALEEHMLLDREDHIDRWRTLVPMIPEQFQQRLIAQLTDTSRRLEGWIKVRSTWPCCRMRPWSRGPSSRRPPMPLPAAAPRSWDPGPMSWPRQARARPRR
jgi:hypothetical protein